jgi:hypothetical protein
MRQIDRETVCGSYVFDWPNDTEAKQPAINAASKVIHVFMCFLSSNKTLEISDRAGIAPAQ